MVLYHFQKDLGILLKLLVGPQVHKHLVHFLFFFHFFFSAKNIWFTFDNKHTNFHVTFHIA